MDKLLVPLVRKAQSTALMQGPMSLSFSYYCLVSKEPYLWLFYQPYIKWGQMKLRASGQEPEERIVTNDTELIIDGFQGSANSYATAVFQANQSKKIKLAHHLHSPSQIIQGAKQGTPILLTIREPEGTVLSLTKRWPYISVEQGLKAYIGFYRKLQPYQESFLISTFDSTINHLDLVFQMLNQKFGTTFDKVNLDESEQKLKERYNSKQREQQTKEIKNKKQAKMKTPRNQQLLEKACEIYEDYHQRSKVNIFNA